VDGLVRGGIRVFRMPLGPTPLVSFAVHRLGLDGGIMVTGSHNPSDQNGFKLMLGGDPLYGEALGELWQIEPEERGGGGAEEVDVSDAYLDALLGELDGLAIANAAWDSGNGATGPMVERLVVRLPGAQRTAFTELDGSFPNHHPDPSVPDNLHDLQRIVTDEKLDLGIAFDGDGDRIGVVDGTGAIVWADQLLLLLSLDLLADCPRATVVGDVKSSEVLFDGIREAGGRAVMSPSGYVLVREAMLRERAPLAGEMSGHIFFGDRWHHADDGLYNAIRTVRALARLGITLADFRASLPRTFATAELRLPCPDERKADVLRAIELDVRARGLPLDSTDGLRVREEGGWWLVRASGTEPKLTARCEAGTEQALDRLSTSLADRLEGLGLDPQALR
ncbi:MAG TPA: phosphomannomutase/phosphoglucomutase, partial [Sphingomicrobium sp.]|nr:phosphomannomutase/phosphoglucomutase [Sphingomicrobium sp.]